MFGALGVVVSPFRPTSRIEGRGPRHHVEAVRRWCILHNIVPIVTVIAFINSQQHSVFCNNLPTLLFSNFRLILMYELYSITVNVSTHKRTNIEEKSNLSISIQLNVCERVGKNITWEMFQYFLHHSLLNLLH